jgi:hypothetical protein
LKVCPTRSSVSGAEMKSDILILDKKSDLNIYKERNQGETASCCGTADEKEPASSCCAPSSSCCSTEKAPSKEEELAKRVAKIDFNEWVSKYSLLLVIFFHKITCFPGSFSIYAVKAVSNTSG